MSKTLFAIKNIALALDASPYSIAALDEAVLLAERLEANLIAICIEDINMINAIQQPYSLTVTPFAKSMKINTNKMIDDMMKVQTGAVRKALEYATKSHKIKYELVIRRGIIVDEVIKASENADILILGWAGWKAADYYFAGTSCSKHGRFDFPVNRAVNIGSSVCSILNKLEVPALVLHNPISESCAMSVYYDGSEEAKKNLHMAEEAFRLLFAYCTKNDERTAFEVLITDESLRAEVMQKLSELNIKGSIIVLDKTKPLEQMALIIKASNTTLLVISANSPVLTDIHESLQKFNATSASILLTR
ncbi:MAG: universal stress protein [Alphaproteobacteria bacterium]|nr:universal stress protein [Alphaproteobacteria bacterium]